MAKHYVYGSGMSGCLYDFGPNCADTREDAIAGLVEMFVDELTDHEAGRLAIDLERDGIHYFARPTEIGAQYCEVSEHEGPCPEGDE